MGWLLGSSTRTPTTVSSFTREPASHGARNPRYTAVAVENGVEKSTTSSASELWSQSRLHQHGVQPHGQCTELARDLFGSASSFRIALAHQRRHHLLDQSDLAIGGGAERPQVAWLQPEPAHLGHGLGDDQSIAVEETAGPRRHETVLLEQADLLGVDPRRVDQLVAGKAKLGRLPSECVGSGQTIGDRRERSWNLRAATRGRRRLESPV